MMMVKTMMMLPWAMMMVDADLNGNINRHIYRLYKLRCVHVCRL